jgi:hypothetical protein
VDNPDSDCVEEEKKWLPKPQADPGKAGYRVLIPHKSDVKLKNPFDGITFTLYFLKIHSIIA